MQCPGMKGGTQAVLDKRGHWWLSFELENTETKEADSRVTPGFRIALLELLRKYQGEPEVFFARGRPLWPRSGMKMECVVWLCFLLQTERQC